MWFAKAWNKSIFLEKSEKYICENKLQNCVEKPESQKKSPPPKVASPLVAAYIVRQAEALERQKKDAGKTFGGIISTLIGPCSFHQRKKRVMVEGSSVTKEDVMIQKIENVEDEVEVVEED